MGDDRNILYYRRPTPRLYRPVSSFRVKRNILTMIVDALPPRPVRLKPRSNDN